jgi:DNA-binding CsgD family transcriptional regulator
VHDPTALIDAIYEASIVLERWPGVLESISKQTESAFGTVFIYREGVHKFVGTPESERLVSDYVALNEPKLNSRMDRSLALQSPGFMTDHDFFTEHEIQGDRFYQDFMHPRGYGWVACTHFPLPNGDMVSISFERRKDRGPFEPAIVSSLDAMRPHFGRSAVLSARLGLERARGMAEALNTIGIPGAVLKPNGSLYVANELFQNLVPHVVEDRLARAALTDRAADAMLGDAIARLGVRGAQSEVRSIPIAAREGNPPIIFHLVPVRGVANDIFSQGLALLIATPVDKSAVPTAEVLQCLFDLTPAEARVARGIAEGKTVEDISLASGAARETIRKQLSSVLSKTGVGRQAELVALLSGKGFDDPG